MGSIRGQHWLNMHERITNATSAEVRDQSNGGRFQGASELFNRQLEGTFVGG
jgi:hypothetical protein